MLNSFLGMLLSLIGFDYRNKRQKDRTLLEKFLEVLPSDSDVVQFLKKHDMGYSVELSYLLLLGQIKDQWRAPDKEFQVVRLERLKTQ